MLLTNGAAVSVECVIRRWAGIATILLVSAVAQGQSTNLLQNGGFDGSASGWTVFDSAVAPSYSTFDVSGNAASGSAYLALCCQGNQPFLFVTGFQQTVAVNGGASYALSARIYSNAGHAAVYGEFFDSSGTYISNTLFFSSPFANGEHGWITSSGTAIAPSNASYARVFIGIELITSSAAYFDNVSLVGPAPVLTPLQASIRAVPSAVAAGQPVTLVWSTTGATSATLDSVGVGLNSSKSVSPVQTTTYTLSATNGSQTVNSSTTVSVTTVPAPQISTFTATPSSTSPNQTVTLSWSTTGAASVSIDNGVGPVSTSGNTTVTPAATTIYSLTAAGAGGNSTRTAQVIINAHPPSVVTTLGTAGVTGTTDGASSVALFNQPAAVGLDGGGNIYVVDSGNHTIRKIDPSGLTVTWLGQAGKSGFLDGFRNAALFDFTGFSGGMLVFTDGSMVIYDHSNYKRIVDAKGNVTTCKLASCAARLFVIGMASDASGSNFYEAESAKNRITRTPKGETTALPFAGSGTAGFLDGQGTAATFNNPRGLAIDASGNLYVGDTGNNAVRKITPGGLVTTLAKGFSFGCCGGMVAVDKQGNVYVADSGSNTIKRITAAGIVQTLIGSGAAGSGSGEGILASFQSPNGVAIDPNGGLVISDTGNGTIRKTTPVAATTTKRRAAGK